LHHFSDWLWNTRGPSYEGTPGVAMGGSRCCGCSGCYQALTPPNLVVILVKPCMFSFSSVSHKCSNFSSRHHALDAHTTNFYAAAVSQFNDFLVRPKLRLKKCSSSMQLRRWQICIRVSKTPNGENPHRIDPHRPKIGSNPNILEYSKIPGTVANIMYMLLEGWSISWTNVSAVQSSHVKSIFLTFSRIIVVMLL